MKVKIRFIPHHQIKCITTSDVTELKLAPSSIHETNTKYNNNNNTKCKEKQKKTLIFFIHGSLLIFTDFYLYYVRAA